MGEPKEWIRAGNELLLARLVRTVGEICSPVVVAGRRDQTLPPLPKEVSIVCDAFENVGPLAGLLAGMEFLAKISDTVFVTPGDHPELKGAFIRRLIDRRADHPAILVRDSDILFPLLGVYRTSLAPDLRRIIEAGEHTAWRFAERVGALVIDAAEFIDVDPKLDSLKNINSPADLQEFEACERATDAIRGDS